MTPLVANLKQHYQYRALLLWEILLVVTLLPFSLMLGRGSPFSWQHAGESIGWLFIFPFFIGFLVASIQRQILTRPFAFCLPGHRAMPRRMVLLVALTVNVALTLCVVWSASRGTPGIPAGENVARAVAVFGMGMTASAAGAYLVFGVAWGTASLGFLYWVILLLGWLGAPRFIQFCIGDHPLAAGAACLIPLGLFWSWMDGGRLARQNCGQSYLSVLDSWNRQRQEKVRQEKLARQLAATDHAPERRVHRFFLDRMARAVPLSAVRPVWGMLYESVSRRVLRTSLSSWGLYLGMMLLMGYWDSMLSSHGLSSQRAGRWYSQDILLITVLMFPAMEPLPLYSTRLVSAGRRERGLCTFVQGLVLLLLVLVTGLFLAGVSQLMALFTPSFQAHGILWCYRPVHGMACLSLWVLGPLILILKLFLRPQDGWIGLIIILSVLFGSNPVWLPLIAKAQPPVGFLGFLAAGGVLLVAWGLALKWRASRADLCGPGKS